MRSKRHPSTLGALIVLSLHLQVVCGQTEAQLADRDMMLAVENALLATHGLNAHRVDVGVEDGVIRLTGAIHSAYARRRAGEVAETISGARAVSNEIAVVTPPRPDFELEADVLAELRDLPGDRAQELTLAVHNGEVSISGIAADWAERELILTLAEAVRGVRAVHNEMQFLEGTQVEDVDLRAELQRRLRTNVWTADIPIQATVLRSEATLAGIVPSAAHRATLIRVAWIPGLRSLEPSGLVVDPLAWTAARRSPQPALVAERELEQVILDSLRYDPLARTAPLAIELRGDTVVLLGTASDLRTRQAAELAVRDLRGVGRVDNRIRVRPGPTQPSDGELQETVAAALARDSELTGLDAEVLARNGEVRLSGEYSSWHERQRAEEISAGVPGVMAVDNRIEVATPSQRVCHDEILRDSINSLLTWNAFTSGGSLTVAVADCRAVLTGAVGGPHVRRMAEQLAFGAGVRTVENQITFGPGNRGNRRDRP